MATAISNQERYTETSSKFDRIDRDAGRIIGVRILGLKSKNGRRYLREAISSAKRLYEGARVYLNHREKGERETRERWGKLVNVREADDGGLIGDLEYLTQHPETEQLLEAIEKFLDIGLSHDSLGRSRMEGNERVIYEIVKVHSVDLVENPATTENLWESKMSNSKRVKFLAVLRENRETVKVADDFLNGLMESMKTNPEMMQEMNLDDMDIEMPEAEAGAPEVTGDEAVKAALRQAILAVLDGPDDSAVTMKKIKALMDVGDKMVGTPAAPVIPAADMEELPESVKAALQAIESKTKEVERVLESVADREAKLAEKETTIELQALLESHGREVTDDRLRLLRGVGVGERVALVESWQRATTKPATSRPKYPQGAGAASSYDEVRSKVGVLAKK